MVTYAKSGIFKPKAYLTTSHKHLVVKPSSIKHALLDPLLKKSIQLEYNALIKNETWSLVKVPPDRSIIFNNKVFQVKEFTDRSLDKGNSILVALRYKQTGRFDF